MNKYARNHRPAKLYSFRGQMLTMAEIAKLRGVSFSCISRRLRAGTPLDRPSQSPLRKQPVGALPEPVNPVLQRDRDIAGIILRMKESYGLRDIGNALTAAWDMGHGHGARAAISTRGE